MATAKTIKATFDGAVFRPAEPVEIVPGTQVELTIWSAPPAADRPVSIFRDAKAIRIDGPPDWSENVDKYLYGEEPSRGD